MGSPFGRRFFAGTVNASTQLEAAHPNCVSVIQKAFEGTVRALGQALELRDLETRGHTDRVARLTQRIAELAGMAKAEIRALRWGAYLHDIGKLAIPDAILLKPGPLTETERETMQHHVAIGEQILLDIPGLPLATLQVVRHHHERWDGTGYPDGLSAEDIPLAARLFAVVDVYDALVNERPYKAPWPAREALAEIERGAGRQFDPAAVALLVEALPLQSLNQTPR